MEIKNYLTNGCMDSIAILLASFYHFEAYSIRNVILQLDSIDDALLVIHEAKKRNLTLDEAVYLRLKGRDEKAGK